MRKHDSHKRNQESDFFLPRLLTIDQVGQASFSLLFISQFPNVISINRSRLGARSPLIASHKRFMLNNETHITRFPLWPKLMLCRKDSTLIWCKTKSSVRDHPVVLRNFIESILENSVIEQYASGFAHFGHHFQIDPLFEMHCKRKKNPVSD